ncbi:MAG TPA: hypothetical protein VEH04_16165 [Verrucomicrobiae bacterium]|nr:hypothetical protein [Verrucomicrobiae bacterium]
MKKKFSLFQWRPGVRLALMLGVLLAITPGVLGAVRKPIALHPENPHYFEFRGKPTVLVTSAEHYGAVINLDFDYRKYLDALAKDGLNNTRLFSGAYVEPQGAFNIARNTLAPEAGRFISPWARSNVPGYAKGGNKFDLTEWDANYFKRLKAFMAHAGRRGIVVEYVFFCPFYKEMQWELSPQNISNNINGIGAVTHTNVYTLDKHGGLLAVHEALVRKVVAELKEFDNVMYEICNEPYFAGVTMEWQHRIADVITDAEKDFRNKHLITQNIANGAARIETPHPAVSVFNFHYAHPPEAVGLNYHLDKVIGDNETGFAGTNDRPYRVEAWAFILAGGALYNNLDYSFAVGHESGTFVYPRTQPGGGNTGFRRQIKTLKDFIHGFDFVKMKPWDGIEVVCLNTNHTTHVLAETGKAYAIYIGPKKPREAAKPQDHEATIAVNLPAGRYRSEWINPLTGKIDRRETHRHRGGRLVLQSPVYREDAALKLARR